MFPPEQEWQRGQPAPLSQITAGVCGKVVEMLLKFMSEDPETQVVAVACQGLKGVVEMVGPAAISNNMADVMSSTNNLLMEKVTIHTTACSRKKTARASRLLFLHRLTDDRVCLRRDSDRDRYS